MTITAETTHGRVEGRRRRNAVLFAGIPYGAPTGSHRWQAPQPADSWTGTRDATRFGPAAPQLPGEGLTNAAEVDWSEDCLSLNVVTPAVDDAKRPVFVWIHGGSFAHGQGATPWYDGSSFAAMGDIVTVTINYRLGVFGYCHLGGLDPGYEHGGHAGLLDQIAALRWVRDNIDSFGGDSERVTVGGESAGAFSTAMLLGHPDAEGLFHRAILQSGGAHHWLRPSAGTAVAEELLADVGVESVAALVDVDAKSLLEAQNRVGAMFSRPPRHNPYGIATFAAFYPTLGPEVIGHDSLIDAVAERSTDVAVLMGTNRDEMALWGVGGAITDERLEKYVSGFTADVDETLAIYREEHGDVHNGEIARRLGTDWTFRVPATRLAEARDSGAPTWMYHFAWASRAFDGALGSCHALEIPFVFNTLDAAGTDVFLGPGATPYDVAEAMHRTWIAFIRDGDPTTKTTDGWRPYRTDDRSVMQFDGSCQLLDDPLPLTRAHWDDRRDEHR